MNFVETALHKKNYENFPLHSLFFSRCFLETCRNTPSCCATITCLYNILVTYIYILSAVYYIYVHTVCKYVSNSVIYPNVLIKIANVFYVKKKIKKLNDKLKRFFLNFKTYHNLVRTI